MHELTKNGLNSLAILNFYRELDKLHAENHSVMIVKNGETVYEEYCYPYGADYPHTMFSITKTAVGFAVGFAIEEGKLTLDTKVLPYFTEYDHPESKEWENLTVKSLLTMNSNKNFSFIQDMTKDHAELFMKATFRKKKGFSYSNNDVHMLSSLVQKVTGENLLEYLTPRLFAPIGIEKPFWEKNEKGVCIGGSGLYLKTRDVAKLTLLILNDGKYNGVQVVPEKWIKESQIKRTTPTKHYYADGFGYCLWLQDGGIRMDGLFGQFGLAIPSENTAIVVTGAYDSETKVASMLHNILAKDLFTQGKEEDEAALSAYLEERSRRFLAVSLPRETEKEKMLSGAVFSRKGIACELAQALTGFPNGFIANSVNSSYARRPKKSFDKFSFRFEDGFCHVEWKEEDETISLDCGLDGEARIGSMSVVGCPYTVWSYGYWEKGRLHIVTRPLNTLATKEFIIKPNKKGFSLTTKCFPNFRSFVASNAVVSGVIPDVPVLTPAILFFLKLGMSVVLCPVRFRK